MATKVQNNNKTRKVNNLRYNEYYDQQDILDGLYTDSKNGKIFTNLMPLIWSEANVLKAYRSIKRNTGSRTSGTDRLTIETIETLTPAQLCDTIKQKLENYQPKAVRRKDIPKPNGKTRPLGIPCIWDRLIQQCILQILEPICEAKFSENSYGFRPLRSAENAIAAKMRHINISKLHYVVEVDIKGFFDEVDHPKLLRQIWTMGIQDEKLVSIIRAILKAPIRMPDGTVTYPRKGTPQGGIISPLLANIVLNEFDWWAVSQWEENPVVNKYFQRIRANGAIDKGNGYKAMRGTHLKEMHAIRYADDIRILCRTRSQADKTAIAVKQWLWDRLKLPTSDEKTQVVNLKKHYSEFLGIKVKVQPKTGKRVAQSHICDKAAKRIQMQMKEQIKAIEHPQPGQQPAEIAKFNAMVRGVHNYYEMATQVSIDFGQIAWKVEHTIKARLGLQNSKEGTMGKKSQDYKRYGRSGQLRFIGESYLLPLGYVQCKNPMSKRRKVNAYTREGRAEVHDNLAIANKGIMEFMSRNPVANRSVEYNDNRLSLFAAQYGRCAITGREFLTPDEVHCHHKQPRSKGGNDRYANLVLVLADVHRLIHATDPKIIEMYLNILKLTKVQKNKLNELRCKAGCEPV